MHWSVFDMPQQFYRDHQDQNNATKKKAQSGEGETEKRKKTLLDLA
jgi:hypothetical protein